MIAETIYVQVDEEGWGYIMMSGILEYQSDKYAIRKEERFITQGLNENCCNTTKGWKLLVNRKYGSSMWENLKYMK